MDLGEAVEAIKSRLSLKEVVSRYVVLKPAGRGRWKGLCPFHQEKTPSFYVDEEKGLFHCFGCKAGGDLIAFVERLEGLDFLGAVERLAEEAGLEITQKGKPQGKRELLDVLKLAQAYFLTALAAMHRSLEANRCGDLPLHSLGKASSPPPTACMLFACCAPMHDAAPDPA